MNLRIYRDTAPVDWFDYVHVKVVIYAACPTQIQDRGWGTQPDILAENLVKVKSYGFFNQKTAIMRFLAFSL